MATKDEHFGKGLTLYGQNKHEEAVAELQKAVEIDPAFGDAYLAMGHAGHLHGGADQLRHRGPGRQPRERARGRASRVVDPRFRQRDQRGGGQHPELALVWVLGSLNTRQPLPSFPNMEPSRV